MREGTRNAPAAVRRWGEQQGTRRAARGPAGRECATLRGYSRMVSNWNLQPTGMSALTTLKPDMVS
jgi:hypothetical protein